MADKAKNKEDSKDTSSEKKSKRAYSRYVSDPVFIGLIILCLLFAVVAVYFSGTCSSCSGAAIVTEDTGVTNTTMNVTDGEQNPKITILEFSDFQCPFCGKAVPTVKELKKSYGDNLEVVFKEFPLSFHPHAQKAAEAGECAKDQGKFWEMHDKMYANQDKLDVSDLKGYAADIGLDTAKFDSCLDGGEKTSVIDSDIKEGKGFGISGTPSFVIASSEITELGDLLADVSDTKGYMIYENGILLVGARPIETFKSAIDLQGDSEARTKFVEDTLGSKPKAGKSIGTFDSLELPDGICTDDEGKPIIRLFTTTWCPHCKWVGPAYNEVVQKFVDEGKISAYHWEIDTGDDSLTDEVETEVPGSELAVYKQFNSKGSIPTFVFGCKYYRIGTGYESTDDLASEKKDFEDVIDSLLAELGE